MTRMDTLELRLLEQLRAARAPVTSQRLANTFGLSEKTVRTHLKELGRALKGHGARIGAKTGSGYWLEVDDPEALRAYLSAPGDERGVAAPPARWEWVHLVIRTLLCQTDYIKTEALDEMLLTNRTSVKQELSQARVVLEKYELKIDSKNRRGIRVVGRERDIRLCLCAEGDLLRRVGEGEAYTALYGAGVKRKAALEELICRTVAPQINLSAYSVAYLARLIWICAVRNDLGFPLSPEEARAEELDRQTLYPAVRALMDSSGMILGLTFQEEDVMLAAAAAAALRVPLGREELPEPLYRRSYRAASGLVRELAGLNAFTAFARDEILVSELALHLPGLFLRSRLHIHTFQFTWEERGECSIMAKKLAVQAMDFLCRHYGAAPDEEETLRLAMIIRPIFGRYPRVIRKLDACCVSSADKAVGRATAERLMRNFGRNLNKVDVLEPYDLKANGGQGYQVLFTSFPLQMFDFLPKTVTKLHAGPFFGEEEKTTLRQRLVALSTQREASYFDFLREENFFGPVAVSDRRACLGQVAARLAVTAGADEGLLPDLERSMALCPFRPNGGVVFLTPIRSHTPRTTVAVFVLKRSILWSSGGERAQIVVYWDRGKTSADPHLFESEALPRILEMTLSDQQLVDALTRRPDFHRFLEAARGADRNLTGTEALL